MNQDVLRMAKAAGIDEWWESGNEQKEELQNRLEQFAKLVEDQTTAKLTVKKWEKYRQGLIDGAIAEREACAKLVFHTPPQDEYECELAAVHKAIIARGQNV